MRVRRGVDTITLPPRSVSRLPSTLLCHHAQPRFLPYRRTTFTHFTPLHTPRPYFTPFISSPHRTINLFFPASPPSAQLRCDRVIWRRAGKAGTRRQEVCRLCTWALSGFRTELQLQWEANSSHDRTSPAITESSFLESPLHRCT